MCMWVFDIEKLILIELWPVKLSHFEPLFALYGMEFV